jgi:tRNA nucleotidyltransferase (CCA-adding enzyme)
MFKGDEMECTPANISLPTSACTALNLLESNSKEAWIVGGCVRDALMGRTYNDIDIATSAHWQDVQKIFEDNGYRTFETGVKHGTITVEVDTRTFEITTYRSDGTYSDARHPDHVTFVNSIKEDLARRDFTVNAMAYHPQRGLFDPFHGQADIAAHLIRCVGNPHKRLSEDALRIIRAVRFAGQLEFTIDPSTAEAMDESKQLLKHIAVERIRAEWEKLLCSSGIHDALVNYIDVLGETIPELLPLKGFDQHTIYHRYDVLEHTAYVIQGVSPTPLLRWAALFHDLGKPKAFSTDKDGAGHFYGHPKYSAELARQAMKRLKMSPRFSHDVALLVTYHDVDLQPEPKAVKRMIRKLDERPDLFRALCNLKHSDASAHAQGHRQKGMQKAIDLNLCLDRILAEKQPFSLKDLAMSGSDILALGVQPGPQIGTLLNQLLDEVIDGRLPNDHNALLAFAKQHI